MKDYSKDRHGLEVLFGLQIYVARLSHPPSKQENQFPVLSRDSSLFKYTQFLVSFILIMLGPAISSTILYGGVIL